MKTNLPQFYFFLSLLAIHSMQNIFAVNRIPDFETTRMKSTAGAGVASILMDEATYLNPATIAFYEQGSFYFQKGGVDSTPSSSGSGQTEEFSNMSVIASDAKGVTGGSISYNTAEYKGQTTKRISAAFARPVGENSSFGVNATYIKAQTFLNGSSTLVEEDYKQTTFGIAHVLSDSISLGFVVKDPFKERKGDTKATAGFQYTFKDFFSVMLDGGADYSENLSDTVSWNAGAQISLFKDFYARFGSFNDKGKQQKGTGAGVGWIQPKLVLEVALKNTDVLESLPLNQSGEEIKETSFSLSYRF
jgi:hypothetical protein